MKIPDESFRAAAANSQRAGPADRQDKRWLGDLERAWLANWGQMSDQRQPPAQRDAQDEALSRGPDASTAARPLSPRLGERLASPLDAPVGPQRMPPSLTKARTPAPVLKGNDRTAAALPSEAAAAPPTATTKPPSQSIPALNPPATPTSVAGREAAKGMATGPRPTAGPDADAENERTQDLANIGQPLPGQAPALAAMAAPAAVSALVPSTSSAQSAPSDQAVSSRLTTAAGAAPFGMLPLSPQTAAAAGVQAAATTAARPALGVNGALVPLGRREDAASPAASEGEPTSASGSARVAPRATSSSPPPDKSSLTVATREDSAHVMLRDASLTDEQGAVVARLLALQLQQLGFASIKTYVNGVARRLDSTTTQDADASATDPFNAEATPRIHSQAGK